MTFAWPPLLFALALVPLLAGLYVWLWRRRRRRAEAFGAVLPTVAGRGAVGRRRLIPPVLFLLALTLLLFALARPQAMLSLPRVEGTVLLVFDVSGSMAAEDLAPTRLEAAKASARALVEARPAEVQIGVVAFSESGFAVQQPTRDNAAVLAAIDRLTPQRGTSLGQGLLIALNALADAPVDTAAGAAPTPTPAPVAPQGFSPAVILLFSDGENNVAPDPAEAAYLAAAQGVRIFTVGVGTTAGATLNIDGFSVQSQLDEGQLQGLAQLTAGDYFSLEAGPAPAAVYDRLNPRLVLETEAVELTALLAGAGLLALLIGGGLSLFWLGRVP